MLPTTEAVTTPAATRTSSFTRFAWAVLAWNIFVILWGAYVSRQRLRRRKGDPVRRSLMVVLVLLCYGCNPNHEARTDPFRNVTLVLDSEHVTKLISQQSSFESQDRLEVHDFMSESVSTLTELERQRKSGKIEPALLRRLTDEREHPERYIPERIAFLNAIARTPNKTIPPNSYCRILQRSAAICSRIPQDNPYYVKVRITSGPAKGQEGWGCLGNDIYVTHMWP